MVNSSRGEFSVSVAYFSRPFSIHCVYDRVDTQVTTCTERQKYALCLFFEDIYEASNSKNLARINIEFLIEKIYFW